MRFTVFAFLSALVLLLSACVFPTPTPTEPYPAPAFLDQDQVSFSGNNSLRSQEVIGVEFVCTGYSVSLDLLGRTPIARILCELVQETPTATPRVTETPTETLVVTESPTPTSTIVVTEPPPVGVHNVVPCHDALDGHTHGTCYEDLPEGLIKDFLTENPEFQDISFPWVSSEVENVFPYPSGKHEGFKKLFFEYPVGECHQFTGVNPPSGNCVRSAYLQVHSPGIADEARTAGSTHSVTGIFEVCNKSFTSCGVVQVAELENYGEIHSLYKETGCPNVPGGVYYPSPYSVGDGNGDDAQPPYVANSVPSVQGARPNRLFWSSLRNSLMEKFVPANYLLQIAWTENAWSIPSTTPSLCANPNNDIVTADSTEDGFINQYVIWTIEVDLGAFDRTDAEGNIVDFDGFTTRDGHPDSLCTESSFSCLPIHIDASVPLGDVFFNLPVRNNNFAQSPDAIVIDLTEPGLVRPGLFVP